ncbi:dual specificity protein phosphatase 13 [Callorhinchus milii]|uniref:Dual specificity protein phosphatase n=1 Tax=Callorhinchus milii TaxID=7868 RepID=V9L2B8_CALMI|nr:dual specificity protein phosphatase 13 [Callorhinchus milii]
MSGVAGHSANIPSSLEDSKSDSATPTVAELEEILKSNKFPFHHIDEVWPNLYLGDITIAQDTFGLWKMGITHVLNAAHKMLGGDDFYGTSVEYYGIAASDLPGFDIAAYFHSGGEFIHRALDTPGGKLLVHCAVGVSRSATLVLAYLMVYHSHSLAEAIETVTARRRIFPNRGFLKQLRKLDQKLKEDRNARRSLRNVHQTSSGNAS